MDRKRLTDLPTWTLCTAASAALVAGGIFLLRGHWRAAFGGGPPLPAWDVPLALAILRGFGAAGAVTATLGIYHLLRRARPGVALGLGLGVCLPALFLSCVGLYSSALFAGWF